MLKARIMRILLFVVLLGMIGAALGSSLFLLRELVGSSNVTLAIPPFRLPPNVGHPDPTPPRRNPPMAPPPPPPSPCEAQLMTPTGSCTQNNTGGPYGSEVRVSLHSGELWIYAVDLEIPGRGFNWKFERVYRSRILLNGPLGFNWEFNYDRRLMEVNPANLEFARLSFPQAKVGDVIRADGYGRADLYVRNPDGSYIAPTGFYTRLIKNPDSTFVERDQAGNKAFYLKPDTQGLANLAELRDRNGNTMRFQYNAQGQLIKVLDTLGRPIDYRYDEKGRLIEVKDFFNRSIKFEYNRRGQLIAVTSPAVTGTPNGNNFPNGKTVRYKYSSGFTDERLENNLLEVTAPNEVAGGGPPRVAVTYDTDPASPNADRVLSLAIGGTNATGVPAGGTIRYEYRKLADPRPGDFNSAVSQTTVTDRNGNVTEYQFNRLGNIVRVREFTNRDVRPGDPAFFETRFEYNKDGEVLKVIYPEGNSMEYDFDDENPDRFPQGNMLSEIRRPDPKRGGDQAFIKTIYAYEPIYNQLARVTEARGNDPSYVPQNGGANSPERYTTVYIFDYQEGTNFAALAKELGVSEAEVRRRLEQAGIRMGLGDVNGDRRTDQINGNVVRIERPTVQLLPACPSDQLSERDTNCSLQARLEGTSRQPIVELYQYNQFGQMTKRIDPEGNVDVYDYYPENDPDGDGRDLTPGVSDGPFGYLKEEIRDAESNPIRNSKTNPAPAQIKRRYFYDRVGNVIKEIDGRGIATEYAVNQLNQVVEIRRAADVSEALKNPEEPKWAECRDQTLIECKAGMVAFKYRTRIFYDFNNNVVKREIENRDSNNKELVGDWITYEFKHDILDNVIEETQEVSENPREILVTKYRYDRNENRVLEISPVANLPAGHPERQPSNVVSYVFDERDLLFTSTRGGLTDQFKALAAHADIPELRTIPNSSDISTFVRRYDKNRNLVEAIDAADNTGDGKPESTIYLYDGFDRQVSVIDAVGNQSFTQYDPASNVIRVSNFGPVGGKSPTDNKAGNFKQPLKLEDFKQPLLAQVEYKYDELNRQFERNDSLFVYQSVEYKRAPVLQDGPLGTSNDDIVVTRYEYDRSSRRTFLIEDDLSVSQTRYDGMNRVIREIDPELNEVLYTYDDNSNTVKVAEIQITKRGDVKAGKVPDLRETLITINVYDALNRLIRSTYNLGLTMRYHYDSRDNLIFTSDAQHSKDDADLIADPLGLYPAAAPASASTNESWWTWLFHKLFGWLFVTARAEQPEQAQQQPTKINRPGNTVEYFYDGINRKIAEVRHLRVDGQGKNPIDTSNSANPDGLIVIDYDWNANNRLVAKVDDGSLPGDQNTSIGVIESIEPKGNVTRYVYDDLNRLVREVFDDNTCKVYGYDPDDNLSRMVDNNGSVIVNAYDGINRLVRKDVTRATSATPHPAGCFKDSSITWQVIGTTLQEFEYDGLSRMTRSFDNNEPDDAQDDATVTYAYDSLSRLLEEVQNGHAVSSRWIGDNNRIGLVYPNGRELEYTFDKLDRINTIKDKGAPEPIVNYDYIGPKRILERTYQNGVRLTYLDNARQKQIGYDGLERVVLHRYLRQDNSLVASFAYRYDRSGNKLFEIKQHENNRREDYTYDSVYQLIRFTRQGELEDIWQLDGIGNWVSRRGLPIRLNNMNEYASVAGVTQHYDDGGALIDDGNSRYEYDFASRLRRIIRKADGMVISIYRYDAADRRIESLTSSEAVSYIYDDMREIHELHSTSFTQQYVYGLWIDELLVLDKDLNNDTIIDQRYFYGDDQKANIIFLTDSKGLLIETISYDVYGKPSIKDVKGTTLPFSNIGNPYYFAGRRLDPETNLYYYRFRYYSATLGRFISRDPLDGSLFLNMYDYVRNNPVNFLDPLGLKCQRKELGLCLNRRLNINFDTGKILKLPFVPINLRIGVQVRIEDSRCKICCEDCQIGDRMQARVEVSVTGDARGGWGLRLWRVFIGLELYGIIRAGGSSTCTYDECPGAKATACCITATGALTLGARATAAELVYAGGELTGRCEAQICIIEPNWELRWWQCCVGGRVYAGVRAQIFRVEVGFTTPNLCT